VLRGKHLLLTKGGLGAHCSLRTNLLLTNLLLSKGLLPTQGLLLTKLLLMTKGLLLGKGWLLTNGWLLSNGRWLLGGKRRPLLAELFRFPSGYRRGRDRWTGRCSIRPAVLLIDLLGRIGRRWRNRNGQEIFRASLDGPEGGFQLFWAGFEQDELELALRGWGSTDRPTGGHLTHRTWLRCLQRPVRSGQAGRRLAGHPSPDSSSFSLIRSSRMVGDARRLSEGGLILLPLRIPGSRMVGNGRRLLLSRCRRMGLEGFFGGLFRSDGQPFWSGCRRRCTGFFFGRGFSRFSLRLDRTCYLLSFEFVVGICFGRFASVGCFGRFAGAGNDGIRPPSFSGGVRLQLDVSGCLFEHLFPLGQKNLIFGQNLFQCPLPKGSRTHIADHHQGGIRQQGVHLPEGRFPVFREQLSFSVFCVGNGGRLPGGHRSLGHGRPWVGCCFGDSRRWARRRGFSGFGAAVAPLGGQGQRLCRRWRRSSPGTRGRAFL